MATTHRRHHDPSVVIPRDQAVRKKVKRRPARRQVTADEAATFKKPPEQTGSTYNLWYNKWAGGDKYDSYNLKEKAQTRCNISTDAGYTRADGGNNAYCCLFFSRGCCPYGSECTFLHRLPPPQNQLPDSSLDVFGREKHAEYRDDMGGVGAFTRLNRTLYIGRMVETRGSEEAIERHFQEWGEIEKLRVLHGRGVAFVTYRSELSAQFAKESMMHQSLDSDEVLNVRWATEDPNPVAKVAEHDRLVKLGEEGIAKRLEPELVDAIRSMDQLEALEHGRPQPTEEEEEEERPMKRSKVIASDSEVLATSTGLVSASALAGLRQVSQLSRVPKINAPVQNALATLGGYGSDSD